jgi:hypothetical protein
MYQIDPLQDRRWGELLLRHPAATVFHLPEWLEALRRTYGYQPIVFTTSAPHQELTEGFAMCRVNSWLTGRRLVSLPFSDHCEPLVSNTKEFQRLLSELKQEIARGTHRYVEFRPLSLFPGCESGLERSERFCFHKLDLSPPESELFERLHKSCVQKKILRAERKGVVYENGHSAALLRRFYDLQVITRRRHQLAPQPFEWFQNLAACMGEKLKVHLASKDNKSIASILTLKFRRTLVCKYVCSDKLFSNLGGMQLLFWKAIQGAKKEGLLEIDLGRSEPGNEGLILFKDHLGATRTTVTYWRYPASCADRGRDTWKIGVAKRVFSHLPNAWLAATGSLLYRHIG